MFEIRKWEPFRELSTIQRDLDDFFRRTFTGLTPTSLFKEMKGEWRPAVNCYTKGNEFIVNADLPGIDPKDVDISIVGNMLTIKGERKTEVKEEKEGYVFHESSYGTFERIISLPEGVSAEKAHATYHNGVLELRMPAKAGVLPKKIKVEIEGAGEGKKVA